jgi:hypothetical protein
LLIRSVLEIDVWSLVFLLCFRVEAAKEAQQKVKEALQKRMTTPFTISKVTEIDMVPAIKMHCSSSATDSLLSSPVRIRTIDCAQDSVDVTHSPRITVKTAVETPGISGGEVRESPGQNLSTREGMPGGDTEVSIARNTFEVLLESLSRTKESIARATRHALDCAKFGIAEQVCWIVVL